MHKAVSIVLSYNIPYTLATENSLLPETIFDIGLGEIISSGPQLALSSSNSIDKLFSVLTAAPTKYVFETRITGGATSSRYHVLSALLLETAIM